MCTSGIPNHIYGSCILQMVICVQRTERCEHHTAFWVIWWQWSVFKVLPYRFYMISQWKLPKVHWVKCCIQLFPPLSPLGPFFPLWGSKISPYLEAIRSTSTTSVTHLDESVIKLMTCKKKKRKKFQKQKKERERKWGGGAFKPYFISEVLWIFANIFTASQSRFLSRGPQLRCCEAKGGGEGGGRGILLGSSLLFWPGLSSRCVVMGEIGAASGHRGHWLATARHRSHMAAEKQRGGRAVAEEWKGEECSWAFPSSPPFHIRLLLLHRCCVSSGSELFSLQCQPEQTSTSTSSISLSAPKPPRAALSSDRHSYPPGRFLSAGLPQQRCSVMWNLISSPPKPDPWPLQSSHNQRGRVGRAGKGGFLGKGHIPEDTFVYARVYVHVREDVGTRAHASLCTRFIMWSWLPHVCFIPV